MRDDDIAIKIREMAKQIMFDQLKRIADYNLSYLPDFTKRDRKYIRRCAEEKLLAKETIKNLKKLLN